MSALHRLRPGLTPPAPLSVAVARFTARHPEWWVVAGAAAAWAVLLASVVPTAVVDDAGSSHAWHGAAATATAWGPVAPAATSWLLMVVAMMGPVMVPRIRHVAACCLGRTRTRAIAETLLGAFVVWLLLGFVVIALSAVVPRVDARHNPIAFAALWLLVAAWQLSTWKTTALRRCHVVRVPRQFSDGPQRVTAGVAYGGWCLASCWPAMTAMAWTGHSTALMAVLTFGLTAERVAHRPPRAVRRLAAAVVVVAGLSLFPIGS